MASTHTDYFLKKSKRLLRNDNTVCPAKHSLTAQSLEFFWCYWSKGLIFFYPLVSYKYLRSCQNEESFFNVSWYAVEDKWFFSQAASILLDSVILTAKGFFWSKYKMNTVLLNIYLKFKRRSQNSFWMGTIYSSIISVVIFTSPSKVQWGALLGNRNTYGKKSKGMCLIIKIPKMKTYFLSN